MKRATLAILSLLGALVFSLPTLAFFISLVSIAYYKYVSALFCLAFAWHTAKLVEYYYVRNLPKSSDGDASEWSEENGEGRYSYKIEPNGDIHFTFRIKDHDGRQLSRLKFMRKNFFKD